MKPLAHKQLYALVESTQVAPFVHGYDAHSFILISQWLPAKPLAHVQAYCTLHAAYEHVPSEHVAPFMQGDEEHSAMGVHFLPPFAVS
jgi:hypothetical protein